MHNLFFLGKWKEIGFGEDYDFNERVVASTEDIYITNDVIYGYHWGVANSLSNTHKKVDNNKYPQYVDKMWITLFFSQNTIFFIIHIFKYTLFIKKIIHIFIPL